MKVCPTMLIFVFLLLGSVLHSADLDRLKQDLYGDDEKAKEKAAKQIINMVHSEEVDEDLLRMAIIIAGEENLIDTKAGLKYITEDKSEKFFPITRSYACSALSKICRRDKGCQNGNEIIKSLAERLKDSNTMVKSICARAIGETLNRKFGEPVLREALQDEDPIVRAFVARALIRLGVESVEVPGQSRHTPTEVLNKAIEEIDTLIFNAQSLGAAYYYTNILQEGK